MTDGPPVGDVTTAAEFEAALESLIATAIRNNIDIRGSWVCRTEDGSADSEVMIYELE